MGVLLQGFYKLRPKSGRSLTSGRRSQHTVVVGPFGGHANDFQTAGFTAIWLPPVLKTSAGAHSGADGYGPFDDYAIG